MQTSILQYCRAILLSLTLLMPAAGYAQDVRTVELRFPRGESGTTVSDTIRGYEAVNYRVSVSAGQRMSVQLDTDSTSNYFNITAPGASEALFNGSILGNSTSFVIPSSGNYIINVYLMRNAARRGETADFSLTVYVEGAAAAAQPAPVPPNFADGLEGGPDFWQVSGLNGGDTLNVRSGPSTSNSVLATVRNGDTLRNLGCTMSGSTRWCQVQTAQGQTGWVAGRYLHESFGTAPPHPSTLPATGAQPVPSNPSPSAVDTSVMPRYCAGEASAAFGVRPPEITTNMAFQSGNRFVVQGYFDRAGDTKFFNCWFGADGTFQSVN
jgi:hypothetical protein